MKLPIAVPLAGVILGYGLEPNEGEPSLTQLATQPDGAPSIQRIRFELSFRPLIADRGQAWGAGGTKRSDLIFFNSAGMMAYPLDKAPFQVGNFSDYAQPSILTAAGNRDTAVVLARQYVDNFQLEHKNWQWQNGAWRPLTGLPDLVRPRVALRSGVYGDLISDRSLDLDDPWEAAFRQCGRGLVRVSEGRTFTLVAPPDSVQITGHDGEWLIGTLYRREEDELFIVRMSPTTGAYQPLPIGLSSEEQVKAMYWNESARSLLLIVGDQDDQIVRAISAVLK
jgi:hypothetical protein